MPSRDPGRNLLGYLLSILLLIAIAGAAVLIALQVRGGAPIRFDVGPARGIECPIGEGTPACFRFSVTNLGNRPSTVRCEVSSDESQRATFLTNSTTYVSAAPFEPGIAEDLLVKVDAGPDDVVTEPALVCMAV